MSHYGCQVGKHISVKGKMGLGKSLDAKNFPSARNAELSRMMNVWKFSCSSDEKNKVFSCSPLNNVNELRFNSAKKHKYSFKAKPFISFQTCLETRKERFCLRALKRLMLMLNQT